MAESLLGGILGEEDEKPDVEAKETLAGADAFAAAIAAKLAGTDPEVARETAAFLRDQSRLVNIQAAHLKDEHAARLHYLRGQAREVDIRRFGLRLRIGFQVFLVLVATAIGIGLIMMILDAAASRSVVIDAIDIAPNVAAEVPSGKIIAAGLLDVLTRIQAASRSSMQRRNLSTAWTGDIAIEVPETGVSIGQLERTLKARFGHDQHIEGDLVQTEKGVLALTVRGTGILPRTFTGEVPNLNKLLTEGGEYVFGQSQPGLWVAYLSNNDRYDDAIRFAQAAYATAEPSERPYLLNYWANAISSKGGSDEEIRQSLTLYRGALRLKPDFWLAYNNLMDALLNLGDEEGVVRLAERMRKAAGGRPGRAPDGMYQNYDGLVYNLQALLAGNIADLESHGGIGTLAPQSGAANLNIAATEVQMHDVEAASLRLKTTPADAKNLPDVALGALVRALLAEEGGDLSAAAQEWDSFTAAYADRSVSVSLAEYICYAAPTYEKTNQPTKADAALNAVGKLTFVDCYRFRGNVLDLRGDWVAAQSWYAKAVKLAPSIPSGYYSWGLALAKHSDLNGAAAKFEVANQKGPHWADPLKAWGDVLEKQGMTREALAKYDEALKYAPNWKELKDARDALAKRKG